MIQRDRQGIFDWSVDPARAERNLSRIFWIAIALAGLTACHAVLAARDLVYDGSNYLLAIASNGQFKWVEPARLTVEFLQQCLAIMGVRLGVHDLWTLGVLFSSGMSGWPVLLTALCWFVLPRTEKAWIAGPLLNLVLTIPVTNLIGIGEGVIASCLMWLVFLLVMFRTNHLPGAAAALAMTVACAFAQESEVLFLGVLAALAVHRAGRTKGFEQAANLFIAIVAAAGAIRLGWWIVFPRSAIERSDFLAGLLGGFLGNGRSPNIPAFVSLVAVAAMFAAGARGLRESRRLKAALPLAAILIFLLATILFATMADRIVAPHLSFDARGLPQAFSTLLIVSFILLRRRNVTPLRFASPTVLTILLAAAVTQAAAQTVMTARWSAYVQDLRALVKTHHGAVPFAEAMRVIDPEAGRFRRELLQSWSVEPLSILLAPQGRVQAVVEPQPGRPWVPYRLDDPRTLPRAPELDWSEFSPATHNLP